MAYAFHYIWSPLEIMCIALIALLLENIVLYYYILLLHCLQIEILAVSILFKCLIAIKCSKIRVDTLQIFFHFQACTFFTHLHDSAYLRALCLANKLEFFCTVLIGY